MSNLSNPTTPSKSKPSGKWMPIVGIALLLAVGAIPRFYAKEALNKQTASMAVPIVSAIQAAAGASTQELVLPASVEAFQQTPIYAKTNGYLKTLYVDIGTHVKAGQLLAEIEVPELDDQVHQASADELQATAAATLAQQTSHRYQALLETDSVSKQDAENKIGDAAVKTAALASARANTMRLKHMQAYTRIYAPFDGVITARNINVGMLVTDSNTTNANALFDIAHTDSLRVYADVPEEDALQIKDGVAGYLTLDEYPGVHFDGVVARNSNALNPVLRTLRIELDVPNKDGRLLSGAYAQLHLTLATPLHYRLPVSSLLFRPEGVQVAVVDKNGTVALHTVTIGRDYGSQVEILDGIDGTEQIVNNPGDAIRNGALVHIANAAETTT